MKSVFLVSLLLLMPLESYAAWITASGKVTDLYTYASRETVLVKLDVNGADVAECSNKTFFAISKDISEEARARMYSTLLAAKVSGSTVSLAFNDVGGCEPWDSNPSVYRVITRIGS